MPLSAAVLPQAAPFLFDFSLKVSLVGGAVEEYGRLGLTDLSRRFGGGG